MSYRAGKKRRKTSVAPLLHCLQVQLQCGELRRQGQRRHYTAQCCRLTRTSLRFTGTRRSSGVSKGLSLLPEVWQAMVQAGTAETKTRFAVRHDITVADL